MKVFIALKSFFNGGMRQTSLTLAERLQFTKKAIVSIQQNFPAPMQHYMTGLLFGYLDKSFEG